MRSVVAFASQVTHLTLVDNNIGDEGALALARGLEMPGCTIEYLEYVGRTRDGHLRQLTCGLYSLSSNKIHAKGAQSIAKALQTSNLKWLR
jgi:hypothetical protein